MIAKRAFLRNAARSMATTAGTTPPAALVAARTKVKLNTDQEMPVIGLGTFCAPPGEVGDAVTAALKAGYRLIDCAAGYGNEKEVGEALNDAVTSGLVKREELFIVSKLFQTHHDWEGDGSRCHESLEQTLQDLQLDYLDLFLMHWPFAFQQKVLEMPIGTPQPVRLSDGSPNPIWTIRMEYLRTYDVMEQMLESDKVKAIGVSNFTKEQLEHLLSRCSVVPAVNQFELNPYLFQEDLIKYCRGEGIRPMAYSPLGSSFTDRFPARHNCTLMQHDTVKRIARSRNKTPAQVLIQWGVQKGAVVTPKSCLANEIEENIARGMEWTLSGEDETALDDLNCDFRIFISFLKQPDNETLWHDGVLEDEEAAVTESSSAMFSAAA